MSKYGGYSLIELMVVMLIFTFLFGAILTVLATQDRSWRVSQNKLIEQQEARKTMNNIVWLLRQSNPDWIIGTDHYPVTITDSNRIDFYQPLFDVSGQITTLKKITFKLNPDDPQQLLKKEGTSAPVVIANYIKSINFGGGCSGCTQFNCSTVANDCPIVRIEVKTQKNIEFALNSQVTLRNQNVTLQPDTEVEEYAEGEF